MIIIKIMLTDIMQYNSYSKIILIEDEKIKNGQIYNIYLKEDGLFSASILKKCYRYHTDLTDASTLREMITDFLVQVMCFDFNRIKIWILCYLFILFRCSLF